MIPTTYHTIGGVRHGFTPTSERDYVAVTTKTRNLGLFRIERFGPDPFTPSGRVRVPAIQHLLEARD